MKNKHLLFFVFLASFLFILLSWNKYWVPLDEGIIVVGAEMVLAGEIPYKDFFLVMYPPGQIFVLALLYKVFGISLEIGRFYTCLIHVLIAMSVFLITKTLTRKTNIALIMWAISMTCLGPRLSVAPFPIWPGIAFALFSIYLFVRYLEQDKIRYLFYSGIAVGVGCLFRHDICIYAFLSIFISLLVYKKLAREISGFTICSLAAPLPVLLYFFSKSALRDLFESLILFPFIHEKTASLFFPKPCFNLNMIFHQSLYFIKANQYYIPLLIYAFVIAFLLSSLIKEKRFGKNHIMLLALLLFGLLSFNQVRIRTDPAHLLTSIHPSILLFGFILNKAIFNKDMRLKTKYLFRLCAILLSFLFFLLVIKNTDKFIKNVFKKPYRGSIVLAKFERGSVYIPQEEKRDVVNVVSFIKANTSSDERIYVGNRVHWKDDFGGSTILYFLAERLPSTKYYELLPGLITQKKVQEEIVKSLSRENLNFIILQDIDIPSLPYNKICPDRMILDNYIKNNFKSVKRFGKYNIYEKR